jgi:ribosomal protein S18 acetylase RimI-like enzyme
MLLRPLHPADRAPLEEILRATDAFTEAEVAVALELIDLGIRASEGGADAGYRFLVAEEDGRVAGYTCYGETPCTEGTYDLYWIAVDPSLQGRGVGRRLVRATEDAVAASHGRMLLVETASKPSYAATRAFYERIGYVEVARIPDFYRPGDAKIVYQRLVTGRPVPGRPVPGTGP